MDHKERTVRVRLVVVVRSRRVAEAPLGACSARRRHLCRRRRSQSLVSLCRGRTSGASLAVSIVATGLRRFEVLIVVERGVPLTSTQAATGSRGSPLCSGRAFAGNVAVRSRSGVKKAVRVQSLPVRHWGRNEGTTPCTSRPHQLQGQDLVEGQRPEEPWSAQRTDRDPSSAPPAGTTSSARRSICLPSARAPNIALFSCSTVRQHQEWERFWPTHPVSFSTERVVTVSIDSLFERAHTRRLFLTAVACMLAALLAVRYFVLPQFDPGLSRGPLPLTAQILDNVSTTIVVTLLVAAFLWWITPSPARQAGVSLVEPRELAGHFRHGLATSTTWLFFGGCGRYFRSAVLNTMKQRATAESTSKSVTAIILNSENQVLCERHARYRAGTRRGHTEGNWTSARVKQELIATIVTTKATSFSQGLLDVEILVSNHFSSFRVDISQSFAIQTKEDPRAPALRAEEGSYYYEAQMDEFRLLKEQATLVSGGECECANVSDVESLRRALTAMNLSSCQLSDPELAKVVDIVQNPENPYA